MFMDCQNIYDINFSNFDGSNITHLSETFKNCKQLKSIDLSDWDISQVININNLFQNCNSLTSIEFPNFKNSNITSMNSVFRSCKNLRSLNFSKFDTSKVTNMGYMFSDCGTLTSLDLSFFDTSNLIECHNMFFQFGSLKSVNLSSFYTPKLKNVEGMFCGCKRLTSLDLSNFDTSQITNMKDFFKNCDDLKYLNTSNFNTSSVANMDRMLSHCSSLTSLDLTHFDTSKVTDMYKMICDCFKLEDLNISNFDTSNVKNMSHMFSNCYQLKSLDLSGFTMESATNITYMFNNTPKLEYINLINSKPIDNIKITNLFKGTSKNLVICTKSDIISQQKNISNCSIISCSENWREEQKKINPDNNNECLDNCSMANNKYDYLSKCVDVCPDSLYTFEYLSKCVNTCPNSTYTIGNRCEKCHPDCNTCDGPFNDTNSNCTSCLSPDKHLENGNCILSNMINLEYLKLNNKDKSIDIASLYNTTNNSMIYNIIKDNLIPLFDPENDFEIISEAVEDVVFQITTSKNQLKALYNTSLNNYNLSILDISKCETILKEKYNLNEDDNLIILKKEKKSNKASEKEIQLEIYEPYNKTKLNLSFCENTNINIYVKAQLSDETKYSYEKLKSLGYDMFNLNDPFYQDICTSYTSYGDTDIILSDRINYIYNNEDTQCQPNCKLTKYSEESEYLNCSCSINEEVNNMNEKFNTKKVFESFLDVLKYSNYKVIKCYNLVFTKYLITRNIGSNIVLGYISIYIGCFIIFIIKGLNPLRNKLELRNENNNNNDFNEINKNDIIINCKVDFPNQNNKNKNLNIFNPPRRKSSEQNFNANQILDYNNNNINNNGESLMKKMKKKKRKKKKKTKTTINKGVKLGLNNTRKSHFLDDSKNKINDNDISINKYIKNKIRSKNNDINKNEIKEKEILDNFELNQLDFYEAIKIDKRTFIQIYWGLLKREHPIIFTFFAFDDYNLIYIKLTRFIFLTSTDMVMNVFFFSDESMHKLYVNYGKYDFIQQIPQILYSTIISKLIEIILCYLSLTDKPIYQIKNLMLDNSSKQMQFIYKCINIKLIIFFVFTFIFIIFYWYIISAFCSVYKNTQITFIKDWIFSFLLGILLPFFLYLIPSSLRICAIKNKNNKCSSFIYKLSEIIPIF